MTFLSRLPTLPLIFVLLVMIIFWAGCSGKSINVSVTVSENNTVRDNLLDPRLGLAVLGTKYLQGYFWHPFYIDRNMKNPSPEWRQQLDFKTISLLSSIEDIISILGPVVSQMNQYFPLDKQVVFSKVSQLESDTLMEDFGFLSKMSDGVSRSSSIDRLRLLSTIKSVGYSLVTFTDYPELVFYFLILEAPDFSKSKYLLKSSDNMNVGAVSKLPRTEYTIFRDIYYHHGFGRKDSIVNHIRHLQYSSYIESFGIRNRASKGVPPTTK